MPILCEPPVEISCTGIQQSAYIYQRKQAAGILWSLACEYTPMLNSPNPLLVILGPTATGKTGLAVQAAHRFNGEIISADSRQVYRGMNLGTGKDLLEYSLEGQQIPVHLIDLHPPGYKYNVYEYQTDFLLSYERIRERKKLAVLCGGSGMYIEAVLGGYKLLQVPVDEEQRKSWEELSDEALIARLKSLKAQHNISDTSTRKRLVRALEIALFENANPSALQAIPRFNTLLVGLHFPRQQLRERITRRLRQRLSEGMVEEVKQLLENGVSAADMVYYGLEYKFLTNHLQGLLSYEEMVEKLNTAIHQFAKRQMTWFRKMERDGYNIHWVPGDLSMEEKFEHISQLMIQAGLSNS